MIWRTLGRMIVVPLSLAVAIAVAGFVLVTLGLERITQTVSGRGDDFGSIGILIELVLSGGILASGLTAIPALAVVVIGEVARIRASLYYIVGGGLALVAIPILARLGSQSVALPEVVVMQVCATAGFAGGWIYWLLAGRKA